MLLLCVTCGVPHVHGGVKVCCTDWDGNVGLRWDVLEQVWFSILHAVHKGNHVSVVHVVHDVKVAHFIVRRTTADTREDKINKTGDSGGRTFLSL